MYAPSPYFDGISSYRSIRNCAEDALFEKEYFETTIPTNGLSGTIITVIILAVIYLG